ncbi:DUF6573 family protein [Reinekea blandensis]|nr:DUF6573 family protein [Reinekea blandensis]
MFADSTVIFAYTVNDAIEDGLQLDVSDTPECKELGFVYGVTLTRAVYENCVQWTEEDTRCTGHAQQESGRLWDLLHMAKTQIRLFAARQSNTNTLSFRLLRVPKNRNDHGRLVHLKLSIEAGDNGNPFIVISFPHED